MINKLDLLSKGWKASEIEEASKILEEAEDSKDHKVKTLDGLLIAVLGALMIANGFVCAQFLVPFIYILPAGFLIIISAVIGLIFSILFTLVIYDVEKIHHQHETNLFIAFIASGIVNFYLILEFTAQFGVKTKLTLTQNIYLIAGMYLAAFLIPHVIYQLRKKKFENI